MQNASTTVTVSNDGQELSIVSAGEQIRYHAIWLRDNAPDELTRSPVNGQRLVTLNDIPSDVSIKSAQLQNDKIELTFSPEEKLINYSLSWLLDHRYDQPHQHMVGKSNCSQETWDAGSMIHIPQAKFDEVVQSPAALKQ